MLLQEFNDVWIRQIGSLGHSVKNIMTYHHVFKGDSVALRAGLCCQILSVCHKRSPSPSEKHLCALCLFESRLFRSHLHDSDCNTTEKPSHHSYKFNFNLVKLSLLSVNQDQLFLIHLVSAFCVCHLLQLLRQM